MENIIKTIVEVRMLTSPQGLYLTQTNLNEGEERTFSEKVFLAKDANEGDWRIATAEEKAEYEQNQIENERI